ncbi:MAG TPA: hypothetical protein VNE63_11685 [Candidatus Acidoferrales bacterium]|nr:hypothetical protein [Candidatus Acidoferrales bacterium]
MQNEEQRILNEVNRRKEFARRCGVITSAFKLFREDIRHYDAWARNCPDLVHPDIKVKAKTETNRSRESTERVDILIRGHEYGFAFRETTTSMPDGEPFTMGWLDVHFEGQRVMTIDCRCCDEEYVGRTWSTGDVSAFIEGPWIAELNSISAEVKHLHDEREKRTEESSRIQKLEELKKNFGL